MAPSRDCLRLVRTLIRRIFPTSARPGSRPGKNVADRLLREQNPVRSVFREVKMCSWERLCVLFSPERRRVLRESHTPPPYYLTEGRRRAYNDDDDVAAATPHVNVGFGVCIPRFADNATAAVCEAKRRSSSHTRTWTPLPYDVPSQY